MAERSSKPVPGKSLSFEFDFAPAPPPPERPSGAPPLPSVAPASTATPAPSSAPPPSASRTSPPAPAAAPPQRAERTEPRVLTVSQLGRVVTRSLDRTFAEPVWVEGEVSGARPAASGHVYFCMKDETEDATIDVVLYRSQVTPRGRALVKDGARIRIRGKPTYWSPRGKLQFVGDRVEPTGKGALLEALEKLKAKLLAEGLFAADRKRPLPHDPRIIGVVTSRSGAVIHDVCKVAFRRGAAHIVLSPAQVQGAGAVDSIRRALRVLQKVDGVDVIILGRGGGSQDDLAAFNDEDLVRDVVGCRVPIVSAVGHEVDVTLVDFAADARAATPSQAAELIVPDGAGRKRLLDERTSRLERAVKARISQDRVALGTLAKAFGDPRLLIASAQQRVDEHVARIERALGQRLTREREGTSRLAARLAATHPREGLTRDRARAAELHARLVTLGRGLVRERRRELPVERLAATGARIVAEERSRVSALAGRLDAMSPLKVLARGYAIVTRPDGHAVRDGREVTRGDIVHVRVADGAFEAEVTDVPNEPRKPT